MDFYFSNWTSQTGRGRRRGQLHLDESLTLFADTMKLSMMLVMMTVALLPCLVRSLPLPQSLTEEQFRSFADGADSDQQQPSKDVKIHSGYSSVRTTYL